MRITFTEETYAQEKDSSATNSPTGKKLGMHEV
jgi:hypothetical protein